MAFSSSRFLNARMPRLTKEMSFCAKRLSWALGTGSVRGEQRSTLRRAGGGGPRFKFGARSGRRKRRFRLGHPGLRRLAAAPQDAANESVLDPGKMGCLPYVTEALGQPGNPSFERQGSGGVLMRPWSGQLLFAMFRTIYDWKRGMQPGDFSARIQVPPGLLRRTTAYRAGEVTAGTGEAGRLRTLKMHLHYFRSLFATTAFTVQGEASSIRWV